MKPVVIAVLCALTVFRPSIAEVQDSADEDIVAAALRHKIQRIQATESLVEGPVRFDNRIAHHQTGLVWTEEIRDQEENDGITSRILAQAGQFEQVRRCPGPTPRECSLHDTSLILAASAPFASGSVTTIVVHAMYMTRDSRQPVHQGSWKYSLARTNGEWTIVSVDRLSVT